MQKSFEPENPPARIEKSEIQKILQESFEADQPVIFTPSGVATSYFCLIASLDESEVTIKNPFPPDLVKSVLASETFSLFCRSYRIEANKLTPRGQDLVFHIPDQAVLGQERSDERFYYSDHDDAFVLISHPFDRNTLIKRKILDTSAGGLSFRARSINSFIQRGRSLPRLQLFVRGNQISQRAGEIVYVTRIVDQSGDGFHQVGIRFTDEKTSGSSAEPAKPG